MIKCDDYSTRSDIYILQCEKISLPPLGRISARGGRNKMGDDGKENVR